MSPKPSKSDRRTICVRVAEIVEGGTKQEFYADLRKTLKMACSLYNAGITECVAQDAGSYTLDGSIPKPPKIATYATIAKGNAIFSGYTSEVANILRGAEAKYKQVRFDVLRGAERTPHQRSHPFPLLSNKSSKRFHVEHDNGNLYLTFRLLGGQWKVRAKSGSNYRDQIRGIVSAIDTIGDSKIWVDAKGVATVGVSTTRQPVKLKSDKVLRVVTAVDALLHLLGERTSRPYSVNADHMVRQLEAKRIRQQRMRQEIKPGKKRQVRRALAKMSAASDRKTKTYIHEATAKVISYAIRNGYGRIEYDDAIRCYARQWPWFDMATKLEYKCQDAGIEFTKTGQPFEPTGDITQPHIYFRLHVSGDNIIGLKIGETRDGTKRDTTGQTSVEEVYVSALAAPKTKTARVKLEKRWLAMFAEHKISGEVFKAAPVITALRERGAIDETLGGSRLRECLSLLGNVPSQAISAPNDSPPGRSNPLVRDKRTANCDRKATCGKGVTTFT